ncbi:O-antigen ligase family protein [Luteococcus peritonei]|uniref:O-antigen ligase family protein n=1 Tax=Luteococcus peritonei TaxID=88874 RepID=A0ABW4RTT3_9ACTN
MSLRERLLPVRRPRRAADDTLLLRRMPLIGALALVWVLLVDWATTVRIGGPSLSAMLTLGTAALMLLLLPTVIHSVVTGRMGSWRGTDRPVMTPISLALFLLVALLRLPANPSMEGVQNVCVYVGFVLAIVLTADAADHWDLERWGRVLPLAALLVSLLFFITFVLLKFPLYGDRSFALSSLVFMALVVPWRGGGVLRWAPWIIAACTVLSLSRTASVIAIMGLAFMVVRGPRRGRVLKAGLIALAAALSVVVLWFAYAPFRERFTSGDAAVQVGGTSLNTSGRSNLWAAAWESAVQRPILGHGPGSATELITEKFITISQPHNEYLRIFHDFGVVGLAFYLWGMLALLALVWRRARRHDRPIDWAAVIALLGILLASITDNMIIYPFVMVPAGVIVGLSLAATDPPAPAEPVEALPQLQTTSPEAP